MRKGQGAMEYLMTYGWAILVVIIVGLVLWRSGIFSGAGVTTATGFDKMRPYDFTFSGNTFTVVWNNYAGQSLTNVWFEYTWGTETQVDNNSGNFYTMGAGGSVTSSVTFTSSCSSGTTYTINVAVHYTTEAGVNHTEYGTITGKCA